MQQTSQTQWLLKLCFLQQLDANQLDAAEETENPSVLQLKSIQEECEHSASPKKWNLLLKPSQNEVFNFC